MKTIVIPVVVGALGTVKKGMVENIEKVSKSANVTEIQKIYVLGSARILRKVLSIWTVTLKSAWVTALGAWIALGWCATYFGTAILDKKAVKGMRIVSNSQN